jgi:hypothetical protein
MTATAPPPAAPPERPPRTGWQKLAFVLISIAVLGIAAMWVYALVFASRDGLYRVDDDAWRENAQEICEAAQQKRIELADTSEGVITDPTPEQMRRRADLVDQATGILEDMLDEVVAYPLTEPRDIALQDTWEGHYRTLIEDRREYTAQLRAGVNEQFTETVVGGGPVTNVVTDFTSGNDIKACGPPADMTSGGI